MKRTLYILSIFLLLLASCKEDESLWLEDLSKDQRELIGTAVNFDASMAQPFQTRITWNEDGSFNERDLMRIYREYKTGETWGERSYRTYYFYDKSASGVSLGKDWRVYPGRKGYNYGENGGTYLDPQSEADSLTWDNGKPIRFRAWSRSNYAGAISSTNKLAYYPDYCISNWVTTSGPTQSIPLVLGHVTCRIAISPRNNGTQLQRVVMCTDVEDYMRADNADTNANDGSASEAGKTEAQAQEELNSVLAVYNKMCMPAGIDINTGYLIGMTHEFYHSATSETLYKLEEYVESTEHASSFFTYNQKSGDYISQYAQRPLFNVLNTSCHLITIPYDISNEATKGEALVLPACTRFRVYLYDVNNGDGRPNTTTDEEGNGLGNVETTYHIFCLGDIAATDKSGNIIYEKNVDGTDKIGDDGKKIPQKRFPDGLTLQPGFSYRFYVGYRYDQLTITADDRMEWIDEPGDPEVDVLGNQAQEIPTIGTAPADYSWWKNAIATAIPKGTENFEPEFHISTQKEFLEFINLVNGTAAKQNDPTVNPTNISLKRVFRQDKPNPEKVDAEGEPVTGDDLYWWWYDDTATQANIAAGMKEEDAYVWVNKAQAESAGYIFYEAYYPKDGDTPAHSEETFLSGSYSFFNERLDAHFPVYLDNDIDLYDWEIDAIGVKVGEDNAAGAIRNPFRGYFDGQMYKLTNVNVKNEYLFNYISSAAIRNLSIETTHKFGLVNQGIRGNVIVGISIQANSTGNSIACSLTGETGSSYGLEPSYVVGCIHVGDAGGALVGTADNLYMLGCMQAAAGITSNTGALLGSYSDNNNKFFSPLISLAAQKKSKGVLAKPDWGRFHCNYYDTELSTGTNAVGAIIDDYSVLEYIRGRRSGILKAKNDQLLPDNVPFGSLNANTNQFEEFYGLAPWKAMNYAIYQYNTRDVARTHKCNAHYIINDVGYKHLYPELVAGAANTADDHSGLDYSKIDPTEQNN